MNIFKIRSVFLILFMCFIFSKAHTQDVIIESKSSGVFDSTEMLQVKFKYSRKRVKKETNDSTYIKSLLYYKLSNSLWDSIDIKIKSRGKFRKKTCYFTPLKLKIKKSKSKNTIFEEQKKLKVVLPCQNTSNKDDYVIKEYIIYKMYEVVSTNHFKTRLLDVEFDEIKNKKTKTHQLKGFLIEDVDKTAGRLNAKEVKRNFYPQGFDDLSAIRNAMFQYMIGNTDYSVIYNHNCKVMYVDKKYVPVSYDFDMSGFVNTNYSIVSEINNKKLPIENVTERYYVGYKRNYELFKQIRVEFLNKKEEILSLIDKHKSYFESENSFIKSKSYIEDFFEILSNESSFKNKTYNMAVKLD